MQFADVVDRADIGMVRRRGGLGFSSKPRQRPALLAGDSALIGFTTLTFCATSALLLQRGLPRMLLPNLWSICPSCGDIFLCTVKSESSRNSYETWHASLMKRKCPQRGLPARI